MLQLARHIWLAAVAAAAVLCLFPPGAAAQQGPVRGRVVDAAGAGVSQADVAVLPDSLHATTDGSGRFSLGPVVDGKHMLRVRRLGYAPAFVPFITPLRSALVVRLEPLPVTLQTIVTNALSARLPRVIQREEEHLGVQLYGPRLDSLLHRYEGMTVEELLPWDRAAALKLMSSRGCQKAIYVDGDSVRAPIRFYISKDEIGAIEVFNSPDFVHEPFLPPGTPAGKCEQLILIWSKYYQQRPWGGH
jgi:Carboxypeptidase regulatory-like domain